jgi:hypothetical protein
MNMYKLKLLIHIQENFIQKLYALQKLSRITYAFIHINFTCNLMLS